MSREYPERPIVGIGVVLLRGEEVLLIRRGRPPNAGAWAIPGGAQDIGETAEAAARRELLEETGVRAGALELLTNVDSIHRDPDGRIRFHYTILDFWGEWTAGDAVAADDVLEAAWARLDDLDSYALWSEAVRVIALAVARRTGTARAGVTR